MVVGVDEQLCFSPVESKGLGFQVWRGRLNSIDQEQLREVLIKNAVDLAIISIPVERKDALLTIQRIGFPYILADILVYFYLDLNEYVPEISPNKPGTEFVQLAAGHVPILDKLIAEIFKGYQNHYTANPLLSLDLITAYQEWMQSYISATDQGRIGWLVKNSGKYVAFVTCQFSAKKSEISLTGIVPEARGRGLFGKVIRFILSYFKDHGGSEIQVSTQLHNYAAQRSYNREGFIIDQAFLTIHINSMLTANKDRALRYQ